MGRFKFAVKLSHMHLFNTACTTAYVATTLSYTFNGLSPSVLSGRVSHSSSGDRRVPWLRKSSMVWIWQHGSMPLPLAMVEKPKTEVHTNKDSLLLCSLVE